MTKPPLQGPELHPAADISRDTAADQRPPVDLHSTSPEPLNRRSPENGQTVQKREGIKWTDVVQALCAVGLLALGTFGYFYTVVPTFQKERLAEDVARLEREQNRLSAQVSSLQLDRTNLERQNQELAAARRKTEEELAQYVSTITQEFIVPQFLIKVQSRAQDYKCRPIVLDLASGEPKPPMTGAALILEGLEGQEFRLLHDSDRTRLIASIRDFVAKYTPTEGFMTELEIRHGDYYSGTRAIAPRRWPDPFHFSKDERQKSERAFFDFDRAMVALQKSLIPNEAHPITSRPCVDLGLTP